MHIDTVISELNEIAEEYVRSLRKVRVEQLGLDPRAGYRAYVDDRAIGVRTADIGSLNYYGGFEYIDKENIKVIGDYTFFRDESRVMDCLDCLEEDDE